MAIPSEPRDIDHEFERFLLEIATLPDEEIESRVEELSPEQRNQLADHASVSIAEAMAGEDDVAIPQLGKIEKFLLRHMLTFFYLPFYAYELHARSCALQAYYRHAHGLTLRQKRNVRQLVGDDLEYDSLQVRFTKAMQRLEAKGLIETFRVQRSLWFADRGRGPEPAQVRNKRLYLGDLEVGREYDGVIRARRVYSHRCCKRYGLVYRLTEEGRRVAMSRAVKRGMPYPFRG